MFRAIFERADAHPLGSKPASAGHGRRRSSLGADLHRGRGGGKRGWRRALSSDFRASFECVDVHRGVFERADAHLLGSKPLCGGLSICALNQHRRRVESCIGNARLRKRALVTARSESFTLPPYQTFENRKKSHYPSTN